MRLNFWLLILTMTLLVGSCSRKSQIEEENSNDELPLLYSKKMSLIEEEYQSRYTKDSNEFKEGSISGREYRKRVIRNINWRTKKIDSMRMAIKDSLKQTLHQ
jgi:hypothetical protein